MSEAADKARKRHDTQRCYTQMQELFPLLQRAFERGAAGTPPYAPELEAWIDQFVQTTDSLLLCLSATRTLFRAKPVIANYTALNAMGRRLCAEQGEDYDRLFRGVREEDHYTPLRF